MTEEQLREALKNTMNRVDDSLMPTLEAVWRKLCKTPAGKTITIKCNRDTFSLWQDICRGCIEQRGLNYVLNCTRLRESANKDIGYENWLVLMQQEAGFTSNHKEDEKNSIIHRLEFKLPNANWNALRQFVTKKTSLELLQDAWETADFLMTNTRTFAPAELGSLLFHDSKRLKKQTLLNWTCRFLRQRMPAETLNNEQLLKKQGLITNPTASKVMVYGPFTYTCNGQKNTWIQELWKEHESACLSEDNLSNLENVTVTQPVLTIENESVFNRMMKLDQNFALVYTAGFPSSAVKAWIAALPPETPLFHWGDGDPEGLEIAEILNAIHPLKLYRMDAENLEKLKRYACQLKGNKLKRAQKLTQQPNFPFPRESRWMLENNLWLEQEAFFNPPLEEEH